MLGVEVSYREEQIITRFSESCLWSRKGLWEAFTEADAGWVLVNRDSYLYNDA